MGQNDKEISKFLSYVLRHAPESIGVTLDAEGWTDLDRLIANANANGKALTREIVLRVVAESDKKRFTLSGDGARIRAAQGHSVDVDTGGAPVAPPPVLFHGSAGRFRDAILREGLRPMARTKVHLSADIDTARKVGMRHGAPIVFIVAAGALHAAGQQFWRADNGVWLTGAVAARFLKLSDE